MKEEVHIWFWLENLRDRDTFEDTGVKWDDNIKLDL
jgi:hypothetical protein